MKEFQKEKSQNIKQKITNYFEYKLYLNELEYKIIINLIEDKIEIICFEEDNYNFKYYNIFTKNQFQKLHKYFLPGEINEIYKGIIDLISNSKIEKNSFQIILKIPIRYFGKTSEISLELNKKTKESFSIENKIQFLENSIEKYKH